jgi:DNA-binding HxlR family transcriptional regulator
MSMTKTPRPGQPVRHSTTGRPIMAALDLIGRRWALRVVWELRDGPVRFRALQERLQPVSPTVLSARLRELREAGVAIDGDEGLTLTAHGRALIRALTPLHRWAEAWAKETR